MLLVLDSSVYRSTMSDLHYAYDLDCVVDFTDSAVVSDAIVPEPAKTTHKHFLFHSLIVQCGDVVVKIVKNASLPNPIYSA